MFLPSNLQTGRVEWRAVADIIDGPDEDTEPDIIPAQGEIWFDAEVKYWPAGTAEGGPMTIVHVQKIAIIDFEGFLCSPDPQDPTKAGPNRFMRLYATNDPDYGVTGWKWKATPRLKDINGKPLMDAVDPKEFFLEAGTTLDLTHIFNKPLVGGPETPLLVAEGVAAAAAASASSAANSAEQSRTLAASVADRALANDIGVAEFLRTGAKTTSALSAAIREQNAPLIAPMVSSYIASNPAIVDAAAAAVDANPKITALEKTVIPKVLTDANAYTDSTTWNRPSPSQAVDVDAIITPGFVGVISALSNGLPVKSQGILETFNLGVGVTQRFTTYVVRVQVFVRHRSGSGNWNEWVEPGRSPVPIPIGADLNSYIAPGTYDLQGTALNMPVPFIGSLEVLRVVRATIHRYTVWNAIEPRVFQRRSAIGNETWGEWYELPNSTAFQALQNEVSAMVSEAHRVKQRVYGSGFKSAHLALNQPSGASTETVSSDGIRIPVTIGVTSRRARLHVRNWNWSVGTTAEYVFTYKGAVSFTGLWAGIAQGKAYSSAPQRVLPAFTTDPNGGEYVSPWFSYDFVEDVQHLVSFGFTNADAQVNYAGRGGCWRTGDPATAWQIDPPANSSVLFPFDIWLELEVPAATPVLAGFGDSNTVGTGTDLPVHDSWLAQYCRRSRAVPMFIANHGSSASTWAGPEAQKWNRFRNVAQADAAVYFLHQNDLATGITLDVLKQRFRDTVAILRERITPNVYAATITPGNKVPDVEAVRKGFNSWLKTTPEGIKECFDFSAAISDDDFSIRMSDRADTLHFNTVGHAKLAAVLAARPVTPRIMTEAEIQRVLSVK